MKRDYNIKYNYTINLLSVSLFFNRNNNNKRDYNRRD